MKLIRKFNESLTAIVYHATYVERLADILKTNRFDLTTNLGTSSDQMGGKFYYMSFSTIKYGGYTRSMNPEGVAILVIDGDKLNQKYKGIAVDYWGPKMRVRGGSAETSNQSLRNDENEERLVTDKSAIPNAAQYIKEIHICLSDKELPLDKAWEVYYDFRQGKSNSAIIALRDISKISSANSIPCYFYVSPKAFINLDKRNAISNKDEERKGYLEAIVAIYNLSWKDVPEGYPYNDLKYILYRAKENPEWIDKSLTATIEADIHNGRTSLDGKIAIANLTRIMSKEKVRTLWDLIVAIANKKVPA